MNLKEQEIWALIEHYAKQIQEMRMRHATFGEGRIGPRPEVQSIIERMGSLAKDLP